LFPPCQYNTIQYNTIQYNTIQHNRPPSFVEHSRGDSEETKVQKERKFEWMERLLNGPSYEAQSAEEII
jgi:hypothetical protein